MRSFSRQVAGKVENRIVEITERGKRIIVGMSGNEDRSGVAELIALIKGSHIEISFICGLFFYILKSKGYRVYHPDDKNCMVEVVKLFRLHSSMTQ